MDSNATAPFPTVADVVGNTPVVRLQRMAPAGVTVLAKLEGANPAGSVKDRPAFAMIQAALREGRIAAGDTVVEATSGNTGIALAAAAAVLDLRLVIVMPDGASQERKDSMLAYGAELVTVDGG
ncbi:MAG: pyridoxal-phosphate dependent enzyme, partial [Demequina sp.]